MSQPADYLLGYLAHFLSPLKGYYGGLLITTTRGLPKEFRHSEGIKPTKLQATLYGDSLEESLGSDALATALYNALDNKPDVLLINEAGKNLFGSFANRNAPSAMIIGYPDPDMAFATSLTADGDLISPMSFAIKNDSTKRVYAYIRDVNKSNVNDILESAEARMNLLSPFDRIYATLHDIAQAEQGRSK